MCDGKAVILYFNPEPKQDPSCFFSKVAESNPSMDQSGITEPLLGFS